MSTPLPNPTAVAHDWHGRAVVVTGGVRGQGAALAALLLQAGADVHVIDTLPASDPAWDALVSVASASAGHLYRHVADVASDSDWQGVRTQVLASGVPLWGLVNNAGITGPRNTVTQTVLAQWQRVLDVNLTGSMLGIHHLAPHMVAGASIVNVSSTVGMTGYYSAAYSCSKWALRGLTRSAAMELAPKGVRVNAVMPGVVDTDMIRNHPALVQALQTTIPMQRMAQSGDIAQVIFFLLSPAAAYITAADIAVDGGVTGAGLYWPVGQAVGAVG
ncbi:FabG Dehydrogenases with different specificities (related to short-chain alcohol dehydrogenases) [Burkholderiaceae bacterium]